MIVNPSAMPSDNGPTAAQVQALSGALDAAGKLHAQAFGSDTIRGLIDQLAKCQDALAGFLPKAEAEPVAQVATPSATFASPMQAPCQHGAKTVPAARKTGADLSSTTVLVLVANSCKATRGALAVMEAEHKRLGEHIEDQRHRLHELEAFFGGGQRAEDLILAFSDGGRP